jgi:peptidoglycan-N-acetylglucosamine deacetylase
MWKSISKLPWFYIILFDIAAFAAFALMLAMVFASAPTGAASGTGVGQNAASDKRIAISFDDSPRGPGAFLNVKQRHEMLLAALDRAGVKQAAFFINPGRIDPSNGHAEMIQAYTDAGHVIANHTANHPDLSDVSAARFLADVDEASAWLKSQKNIRPWLRFPHLNEGGRDTAKRDAVRAGMKARGIRHGYASADGWDWYMESMTLDAAAAGKPMDMNGLRKFYIKSHIESVEFSDNLARRTFGRAPAQMLLLHDTDLAALYVEDLVRALRAKGWQIITADEAYKDPIYREQPMIADTNGTIIQMLSWEKGTKGPRWYQGNDRQHMQKLFAEQVLRE